MKKSRYTNFYKELKMPLTDMKEKEKEKEKEKDTDDNKFIESTDIANSSKI